MQKLNSMLHYVFVCALSGKAVLEMIYYVLNGMLNLTHSLQYKVRGVDKTISQTCKHAVTGPWL